MGFTYRRRTKRKEYAFVLCGNIENNIILPSSVQAVGRVQRPAADFPFGANFNIWRLIFMKWRLEITDIEEYNKTQEFFHCTDVHCFSTLQDVWNFLGFKLKKERCGYAGINGNFNYCLTRM